MAAFFVSMLKQFEIEYMRSPGFRRRLQEVATPFAGNLNPITATLAALQRHPLSCQSVVFEYRYVDKDYQDEFAAFYSKAFKDYPSRCTRMHFFSSKLPKNTRIRFGKYKQNYLGFVVLRPTDLQRMGPTAVLPPITDPDRQFVHCLAPFKTHILGDEFIVTAMPFIQQDTQVGACAQAALWMLTRYMSRQFGLRDFLPAEINQRAKAKLAMGRPLPAELGLNWVQMLDALEGVGLSALSYSLKGMDNCSPHIEKVFGIESTATDAEKLTQHATQRTAKLADIAYRYIESGLPVILGTADHALVAIGHTYDPAAAAKVAIQRIPSFFVHNDNAGPYLEIPIFATDDKPSFRSVEDIIAVVPQEVTLRGEEAESMAAACTEKFLDRKTPPPNPRTYREFISTSLRPDLAPILSDLEYRTYLIPSIEFQSDLLSDIKSRRFDKRVGEMIIKLDYPKYLWVTEISSAPLLNQAKRNQRRCLGRVIIDSTAPSHTRGEMVIQIADFVQINDRQSPTPAKWEYFPNLAPFGHKLFS